MKGKRTFGVSKKRENKKKKLSEGKIEDMKTDWNPHKYGTPKKERKKRKSKF